MKKWRDEFCDDPSKTPQLQMLRIIADRMDYMIELMEQGKAENKVETLGSETACEHEPAADRIKIIPRLDGDDKLFEEFIPVFDGKFHCKHCGKKVEPTGWRLVE